MQQFLFSRIATAIRRPNSPATSRTRHQADAAEITFFERGTRRCHSAHACRRGSFIPWRPRGTRDRRDARRPRPPTACAGAPPRRRCRRRRPRGRRRPPLPRRGMHRAVRACPAGCASASSPVSIEPAATPRLAAGCRDSPRIELRLDRRRAADVTRRAAAFGSSGSGRRAFEAARWILVRSTSKAHDAFGPSMRGNSRSRRPPAPPVPAGEHVEAFTARRRAVRRPCRQSTRQVPRPTSRTTILALLGAFHETQATDAKEDLLVVAVDDGVERQPDRCDAVHADADRADGLAVPPDEVDAPSSSSCSSTSSQSTMLG